MHKLKNTRAYLCGAISYVTEDDWRQGMGMWLKAKGVVVLDPLNKPLVGFDENLESKIRRVSLREQENWDQIAAEMRLIRCIDLRMVDICDFIIVHIDLGIYTVGTWEEVTLANRQKKPILMVIRQGKGKCPDWVFGMFNHETIFDGWDELKDYLDAIDGGIITPKRWRIFQF